MIIEVNIMNELMEFLSTDEVRIVIAVAIAICILGTLYFVIEKSYHSKRKKRNTKELNELIEQLEDNEKSNNIVVEQPVIEKIIEPVTELKKETSIEKENPAEVIPLKVVTVEEKKQEVPLVIPIEEFEKNKEENSTPVLEIKEENKTLPKDSVTDIYEKVKDEIETLDLDDNKKEEPLQYTDAVSNQEEAKEELRKATIELLKAQEKQEQQEESKNIELTEFEEEQEKNAIISVEELMKKSDVLYEQNEVTQYADEGNEPISLQDLEMRMNNIKEEAEALNIKEQEPEIIESRKVEVKEPETNKVVLDDFYSIDKAKAYNDDHVFKSSPIISPIFGIEKQQSNDNSLELENTANYEKLDEEIKKTNEFLGKLRELQKNLDEVSLRYFFSTIIIVKQYKLCYYYSIR